VGGVDRDGDAVEEGAELEAAPEIDSSIDQPYDAMMRRWAERNLPTVAGWLDPTVAGLPPKAYVQRPATFALPSIFADLLTTAGKNRLLHVEYETSPRPGLIVRMFNYRARIMTLYPRARLSQHVIVLGSGRVRGHDDVKNGFILDVQVVYLRERDPAEFLHDPVMAPLAVLARGPRRRRERSFAAALRLIRDSAHPRTGDLLQIAETLALIRLDAITIRRIRKENGMSIQPIVDHYRDTEVGQHLQRLGRQEGRQEEKASMLFALLHARFGDQPETAAIVRRLSGWTDSAAVEAILSAPNLSTLITAEPPA
jgi:hypothetical protein